MCIGLNCEPWIRGGGGGAGKGRKEGGIGVCEFYLQLKPYTTVVQCTKMCNLTDSPKQCRNNAHDMLHTRQAHTQVAFTMHVLHRVST